MDPITGVAGGVPGAQPTGTPEPTAGPAAPANATSDAQIEQYKAVAAGFVSQMYMTIWREAQRNGSAGA